MKSTKLLKILALCSLCALFSGCTITGTTKDIVVMPTEHGTISVTYGIAKNKSSASYYFFIDAIPEEGYQLLSKNVFVLNVDGSSYGPSRIDVLEDMSDPNAFYFYVNRFEDFKNITVSAKFTKIY